MTLEYGVLGPVEVRRGGDPVPLGGPQQRRIVAVLLAERGRVVSVDRLVDAVWPDAPPDGARRTVMTYVSRLRLALGDGHVVTHDQGYCLDPEAEALDAIRFERLVDQARSAPPTQAVALNDDALALWRGRAFGEFADEWWALPLATRWEELRIVAAEQRAEALVAMGALDRAVADLEGLVATYPLRERALAQLMTAYDASGRQSDALRVYTRYRVHLAEETGLEPSDALRGLESTILAGKGARPGAGPARATRGYRLGAVVGEGAFATVYRAVQPGVGREVAVKVIRAELADDPAFVRRFEAEAQLVAHLEHPHIVPLYDFWREPGGAYLVFRLLRGGTAADLVQRAGPLPLSRVERLVTEIGGALVTSHAAGVVHRDVKPTNVLFDEGGNGYLADFGIATSPELLSCGETALAGIRASGSPLYAAPEQFQHTPPSPLCDQYSFAAMVWELLAGRPPFEGSDPSTVLRSKLQRSVGPLHPHRGDLPRELDLVLQRATARRPDDRYPSMSDLLAEWHSAARSEILRTDGLDAPARRGDRRLAATTPAGLDEVLANPYRGLLPFGEADARHFHGRDGLVTRLLDDVTRHSFVTVVGASGSGKSSLVSAGLVPRLRAAGMRVAAMVPGDDPVGQLRVALLSAAPEDPGTEDVAALALAVAAQPAGALVLLVDQLEELWTLAPPEDRDRFAGALATVVGEPADVPLHVVVTIRADFFDRPLAHPDLGRLVAAHPFAVTPMTPQELHDAVVGPAAALGVVFEPGLDSAVVADVVGQPSSLPLLQFTLAELFGRRQGSVITAAAYEAMGGIAGAVASRAEELYAALDGADRDAVRRLLLRLVVPGEDTEDTRRRVRYCDLPAGSDGVLQQLETQRLLVADRDPATREPTVEIAHESLLRSWPRLRGWLVEDRDRLRRIQHVAAAARAWTATGRSDSELYRGARLDAAAEALAERPDELTETERDFVRASAAAALAGRERERRARRRLRRGLVTASVALVVALLAGSVAVVQWRDANTQAQAAEVSRLVALSQSLTGTKREVAMLLAVEAARRDPGAATTGALLGAIYADPSFVGYLRTGTPLAGELEYTPDGRYLYANPQDYGRSPVRVDVRTGTAEPVPVRDLDRETLVAQFVPVDSGSALVTRQSTTSDPALPVERVDLTDGHVLGTAVVGGEPWHVTVSPDRTRAAVTTLGRAGTRSRVVVVDLATMAVVASVDQPGPAYADDGSWAGESAWVDDRRLVVGSPSGRLLVWAPDTGRILLRVNDPPAPGTENPRLLEVTSGGGQVVVAGATLMAYDLATGTPSWPVAKQVGDALALDPRAGVVWAQESGFGSSRLFGYDLATGERVQGEVNGQRGTVCDADVSPDTRTLAVSSCNEGTVALWALDGATATGRTLAPSGWASSEDLWSPDGAHVAVFRTDRPGAVEDVDVRDGSRRRVAGVVATASNSPTFRPDGVLQTVDDRNRLVEYDPRTGSARVTSVVLPGGSVTANVALRPPHLSAYGLDDGTVVVVDTAAARVVRRIRTDLVAVYGLGWSADGRRLFAAGQTEHAEVLDVATGRKVATLAQPAANLVVRPGGGLLATAAFDGTIRFVDAATLEQVGDSLSGGTAFAAQIQFTPDGRTLIASGLDNTMRLFDVASRRPLGVPLDIASWGAAVSPDSTEIAVTSSRGVGVLALDRDHLARAACRLAARDLTAAEWAQYVGGEQHRLCPA